LKIVDRETLCDLQVTEAVRPSAPSRAANTEDLNSRDDDPRRGFNRHLYDNLLANLESQIEGWNRSAVRDPNPEAAHALWLKAEGLGYAVRLLYAFEPEFRELVECASLVAEIEDPSSTVPHLERKSP
jgi:hypothetical protein